MELKVSNAHGHHGQVRQPKTSASSDTAFPSLLNEAHQEAEARSGRKEDLGQSSDSDQHQESPTKKQDMAPESNILKNMLNIMSQQVINIVPPGPIEGQSNMVEVVISLMEKAIVQVEKTNDTTFRFKVQGEALEIQIQRTEKGMAITLLSAGELKKELIEHRYQLSDLLKAKMNTMDLTIDIGDLDFDARHGQGQGQQQEHPSDQDDKEDTPFEMD